MRTAFIDRCRRFGDTPYRPDLVFDDFTGLARATRASRYAATCPRAARAVAPGQVDVGA